MQEQCNEKDLQKAINYWLNTAEHDLDSAESLFKNGRYAWGLFLGHLVLEKMLKALWVKINKDDVAPRIHNLLKLAKMCDLKLSDKETKDLETITGFNLEGRYPEDEEKFYRLCTKQYAKKYFDIIESWRKKILKQLKT